jgi:cysteinyl-tRNA synthetase
LLKKLGGILGVLQEEPESFLQSGANKIDVDKIESLIAARNKARADKNWQEADRLRDEIASLSVVLEDGAEGTTWKIT